MLDIKKPNTTKDIEYEKIFKHTKDSGAGTAKGNCCLGQEPQ